MNNISISKQVQGWKADYSLFHLLGPGAIPSSYYWRKPRRYQIGPISQVICYRSSQHHHTIHSSQSSLEDVAKSPDPPSAPSPSPSPMAHAPSSAPYPPEIWSLCNLLWHRSVKNKSALVAIHEGQVLLWLLPWLVCAGPSTQSIVAQPNYQEMHRPSFLGFPSNPFEGCNV